MDETEIIVSFPEDMVREIEAVIAKSGESFSDFVNNAIDYALAHTE